MNPNKRATLKDLAKEVGVSARSISLALNGQGRLSASLRQRIIETADRMEYRPNVLARGLVNKRTYQIGFACPLVGESFFAMILGGVEQRCAEMGFDILLGNTHADSLKTEKGAILRLLDRKVDVIIAAPDPRAFTIYQEVLTSGTPLLQIMTRIVGLEAPFLGIDNIDGGFQATKHLTDWGHREVGFLSSPNAVYNEINHRYQGYLKALASVGARVDTDRLTEPTDQTPTFAQAATATLLDRNPALTAIFAPTDLAAIGAVRACLARGLRVPEDVSVVGFDDLSVARDQIVLPLTTMAQPKEEIGRLGFDMGQQLFEGTATESVLLKASLVVRSTTGPVR